MTSAFSKAFRHGEVEILMKQIPPSLPVIAAEVNGLLVVGFWGSVIPPHVWCLEA